MSRRDGLALPAAAQETCPGPAATDDLGPDLTGKDTDVATAKQDRFDATKPFYAGVGAGDVALAHVRRAANDLTAQLTGHVEEVRTQVLDAARSHREAAEQARARVVEQLSNRLEELAEESRDAQTQVESRIARLQAEALALLEQLAAASRGPLEAFDRLAARGETVVRQKRAEG